MRILQLGRFDFDDLKGGVQAYADLLVRHMNPDWHIDQLVSSTQSKTEVFRTHHGRKIRVASYGTLASVPLSPTLPIWAVKLFFSKKYDVLHLNFPDPWGLLVGGLWVLLSGIFFWRGSRPKIVVTWHSDIIKQKRLLIIYQPILKFFVHNFVERIFVATEAHIRSCRQLQECHVKDKIRITPFGIETDSFVLTADLQNRVSEIRQKYPDEFLLFTFGRHVPYKGFRFLIEAMQGLYRVRLFIGGAGPLTSELKSLAKHLPVEFLGPLEESELVVRLHACDVFCFPSIDQTEAYGYAQIEAMVCGKPVLGTYLHNGVNEVNLDGVTGLCVEPGNSRALRGAIRELQQDPSLLLRLSHQAKERAWKTFSARSTASQTETFLSEIVQ